MYVVSLTGFKPTPRYDEIPWTEARIEESPAIDGPWTLIDTIALVPDADPSKPAARDLTTENATLPNGWYRVIFADATGDTSLPTDPVSAGAVELYRPTVQEVADFIRARTKDKGGNELGTFNEETRPTGEAVERLIGVVMSNLAGCVGPWLPEFLLGSARTVIALSTAMMVELSYFPEQIEDNQSAYKAYEKLLIGMRKDLCSAASPYRPEGWSPSDTPLFYFGDGLAEAIGAEWDPETERYIFRGEPAVAAVWNT